MNKIIVGYVRDSYPVERNILYKSDRCSYRKVHDVFKFFQKLFLFFFNKPNASIGNSFFNFDLNNTDIIHLFNGVSYGKKPWISTYETVLPRFESTLGFPVWGKREIHKDSKKTVLKAIKAMASASCKKMIAISEFSYSMQKELLVEYPIYQDIILSKTVVIHPPQILLSEKPKKVGNSDSIKYLFVGTSFFTKGGLEMLKAFKKAVQNGAKISLIIVSSLRMEYYAAHEKKADMKYVKDFLAENKDWVKRYSYLPNKKVLSLMKESHVGILPTLSDTYGYSVLELQSSGCPVISTAVGALREINNNDIGWMINVDTNKFGEATYIKLEEREKLKKSIENTLYKILMEIDSNKNSIEKKSILALAEIRKNHSLVEYSKKIENIYIEAVEKKQ
jgi:glycosyltransferase involved in cell wall biosynthesis